MDSLIPQLLIILSLVGIIIILVRKIPAAAKMEIKEEESLKSSQLAKTRFLLDNFRQLSHKYLGLTLKALEKLLKQLKIGSLKIESKTSLWIQELRKKSQKIKRRKDLSISVRREKEWIKIIAENPKDIEAYKKLGLLYLKQENYKDARASFQQVLKINSKDKEANQRLKELEGK